MNEGGNYSLHYTLSGGDGDSGGGILGSRTHI